MSLLSNLQPKEGSTHYSKRIGRGIGSGMGGTATKGHKGQLARTGGRVRRGFEGGQTPLSRRLPKFGFSNAAFSEQYEVINLSTLNKFKGEVDPQILYTAGILSKNSKFKVLASGVIDHSVVVKAHFFSKKAKEMIEKQGRKAEVIK